MSTPKTTSSDAIKDFIGSAHGSNEENMLPLLVQQVRGTTYDEGALVRRPSAPVQTVDGTHFPIADGSNTLNDSYYSHKLNGPFVTLGSPALLIRPFRRGQNDQTIFQQGALDDFEVIVCDDGYK